MSGQLEIELRRFLKSVLLEVWQEIQQSDSTRRIRRDEEVTAPTPKLLKVREAAAALSISEKHLWGLTKSGIIPCVRLGQAIRYDVDMVQKAISQLTAVTPPVRSSVTSKVAKVSEKEATSSTKRKTSSITRKQSAKILLEESPRRQERTQTSRQRSTPRKSSRAEQPHIYKSPFIQLAESLGVPEDKLPRLNHGELMRIGEVDKITFHGWAYLGKALPEEVLDRYRQFILGLREDANHDSEDGA